MPPRGRGGQPTGRNIRSQGQPQTTGAGWTGAPGWDDAQGWANITSWDEVPGWANATGWDGAPGWDAMDSGGQGFAQPPWEAGVPEPDPSFMYREPGPGMPGYRGPGNRFRGGDDLR
jgi:hypothetical protein